MTETTNGTTERGPANQRHFVRAVDNDMDGDTHVVCSFGSGHVALAVPEQDMWDVLGLAAKWGGQPSFDLSDAESWRYNTGEIAVDVAFE